MAAGADCIDGLVAIRAEGMKRIFGEVYAAATLGSGCASSPTATACSWRRWCGRIWLAWPRTAMCYRASGRGRLSILTRCCGLRPRQQDQDERPGDQGPHPPRLVTARLRAAE